MTAVSAASFLVGRCSRKSKKQKKQTPHSTDEISRNPDALFAALVNYFNVEKPYLNPDLKVKDVTKKLLTNRTYLNEAIKENDKVDFPHFVNEYRIRMAVDILRMDRHARIGETGIRCGFKTPASFTMAFKVFLGVTPKQWKDGYNSTSGGRFYPPKSRSDKGKRTI